MDRGLYARSGRIEDGKAKEKIVPEGVESRPFREGSRIIFKESSRFLPPSPMMLERARLPLSGRRARHRAAGTVASLGSRLEMPAALRRR